MGTSLGVSDTMGLVSSKLIDLVPYSACALFLYTDSTDSLLCRFAIGNRFRADPAARAARGGKGSPDGWHAIGARW
jgi:hypothetical protein